MRRDGQRASEWILAAKAREHELERLARHRRMLRYFNNCRKRSYAASFRIGSSCERRPKGIYEKVVEPFFTRN